VIRECRVSRPIRPGCSWPVRLGPDATGPRAIVNQARKCNREVISSRWLHGYNPLDHWSKSTFLTVTNANCNRGKIKKTQ